MIFFKKKSPFVTVTLFYLLASFILRLVLLFHPITQSKFGLLAVLKIFSLGFISDVFVFIVASGFLWLYLLFLSNEKYQKPWGYVIFGLFVAAFLYVYSGKSIFSEYGGSLEEIALIFVGLKTLFFGLLLFLPRYRATIRYWLYSFTIFLFVLLIIQNSVSEFFFWNEFGVRYNFIAVDYLVYTNTVIGNIMESYPVVPLFTGVGVFAFVFTYLIVKRTKWYLSSLPSFGDKLKNLAVFVVLFSVSLFAIPRVAKAENSTNVFTNELQANGIFKFYNAFLSSELDYEQYYQTLPEAEAFGILGTHLTGINGASSLRTISNDSVEIRKNIVLITLESFSEEFLTAYGSEKNITPFLDELSKKSLFFGNLYATGNRTVRGLEAVTLSLPPSPGESVVKRKDNANKFSTGHLLKEKGYEVKYMYGGDAFFDNMGSFFGGNGYAIVDKKTFAEDEITFSNIWGVCDEDMYNRAIKVMNEEAKSGKPFFNHIMTVSNHRPFTYPDGKIDISNTSKSREGGVKYTDYALKQFFAMAEKQAWFKNTIFVIVSDHCASSSGKTELPMDKYRIPGMVYAPGFIAPRYEHKLMSQIDVMPTVFGFLKLNYQSKFYGQDIYKPDYQPRAFIATYQDLGYIKDDVLTIISPVKQVKQFKLVQNKDRQIAPEFEIFYEEVPMKTLRPDLVKETIAYYQTTAWLLKNKKLEN